MLYNANRVIGRAKRGSKFCNRKALITTYSPPYTWTLTNSLSEFTFQSDPYTGVRLVSFKSREGETTWVNSASSLWSLNIVEDTDFNNSAAIFPAYRKVDIHPSIKYFSPPSVVPVVDANGTKSFRFIWSGVPYNRNDLTKTCTVTLLATLGDASYGLRLSLSVKADHVITASTEGSVCISCVHMPYFAFKQSGDDEEDKNIVFTVPLGLGVTYRWPHKYLKSYRFLTETYNFSPDNHRIVYGGQPFGLSPTASTYRANYGSPGWMSMPCIVWGNREDKEGFLICADDPDGLHAKGWQWFNDDKSIHLRVYDVSDHEIDPYGMGGKNNPSSLFGNSTNTIGWDLCIRPFVSPSRWVDWYGFKLYKQEYVDNLSWQAKPFYEQYEDGKITLEDLEIPIVYNIFGHLSGNADDAISGANFYIDTYKNVTNPVKSYSPRFVAHMQSVTLNYKPNTVTSSSNYASNYWGWEPWAQQGLGTNYGPDPFKAPDFDSINSFYGDMFSGLAASGIYGYPYLVFPFKITSGSAWTTGISGQDLIVKGFNNRAYTYQYSDYYVYARSNISIDIFSASYSACLAVPEVIDKFITIGGVLASGGAGAYHDTVGSWGRGCYANKHTYRPTSEGETHLTHPRGYFTHYYNSRQDLALSGFANQLRTHAPSYAPWSGTDKLVMAQAAEFHCDTNLRNGVYTSLYYDVQHPVFNSKYAILGEPRRDTVTANGVTSVHAVSVEPPHWLQKCPAYSIAYGDRHIYMSWGTPHLTNAMDLSGNAWAIGEFSGINPTTYASVHYENTHEHRVHEWAAWLALTFDAHRRLSVSHQSSDYGAFSPAWYTVSEDHEQVFTSPQWSGFFDYVKQHFRLMSYEPDYLYHGTLEHPLDDWTTTVTTSHSLARSLRTAHYPQLVAADYSGLGDDVITHFMIRDRDSDRLLLSLSNWWSGQASFSFNFDPLTYGVTSAYSIYSLDLNTSQHGTKSLIEVVSARQTWSYSVELEGLDMTALEIVPLSSSSVILINDLATSYASIRYSYDSTDISTSSLPLSYSYGSTVLPVVTDELEGFKAPMTQQITNNLPQWMAIRNNTAGEGWMFVNSWGMNLESILTNTASNLSNVWLLTTDNSQRNAIYRTDIDAPELVLEKEPKNLLFNSSFSIKDSAIYNLPAGWTDYYKGNVELSEHSAVTPASLKIDREGTIAQFIELDGSLVHNLVASVYLQCNDTSVDVKLIVSLETSDGLTKNYSAELGNRSTQWRRLVLPIRNVNARVTRIKFLVRAEVTDCVYVSAPQIEIGTVVSSWSRNRIDYLPYITPYTRFNLVQVLSENSSRRIPVFGISNDTELTTIQIPTRITKCGIGYVTPNLFASHTYGRKVDFFNEVYDVNWTVQGNKILERSAGPSEFDIFNVYTIKDLRFHDANTYGTREDPNVSRSIISSCVRNNMLLVLVKEQKNQVAKYIIKVVVPRTPPNREAYLESIVDFDLDLNFDTVIGVRQLTEEALSLGISETDPNLLVVNTSLSNRIYYRLCFDYYYFDIVNNQMYTLENYNGAKIQIL